MISTWSSIYSWSSSILDFSSIIVIFLERIIIFYCFLYSINILSIEYLKFIYIYRRVHVGFWIQWSQNFCNSPQKNIRIALAYICLTCLRLFCEKKPLKLTDVIVFHPATRVYIIRINTLIPPFLPLTGKRNARMRVRS